MEDHESRSFEARLTRTETTVDAIASELSKLTNAVSQLGDYVRSIGKTDLTLLIRTVGLVIAVLIPIGAAFGGYVGLLSASAASERSGLAKELERHMDLPGHSGALVLQGRTAEKLLTIDERLNRVETDIANRTADRWTRTDQRDFETRLQDRFNRLEAKQ